MSHRITMTCIEQSPHSEKSEVSIVVDRQNAHIEDYCEAFRALLIASGFSEMTADETSNHVRKGFRNG